MAYQSWSVVFGEQPSAAKWNILGTNDASFNTNFTRTGMIVQEVTAVFTAVATGTTAIPLDDTIPQNTEGDEYMTLAITPTSSTNRLVIICSALLSSSISTRLTAALFQDTTANALAVGVIFENTATAPNTVPVFHSMLAGTTSSTTFKIRAGSQGAATTTFNGSSGASIYGAITKSSMIIREIVG